MLFRLIIIWGLLWPARAVLRAIPGIALGVKVLAALEGHNVYA